MNTESSVPVFAGAWRRIGAFVIDAFLLGLIGIGLGYFLFDALVGIGSWGRLVGFLLAMAYFVPLNSSLGHGQTVGKRLLKIQVIRADGSALPVHLSLLRYAIIGIPWFLNGAWFPAQMLAPPWIYLLALLVFGVGLALLYLFLFNRPSRQSLHDLAVGSFVVNAGYTQPVAVAPLARVHAVVVPAIAALSLLLPAFTTRLIEQETWAPLMRAYERVNSDPMVLHAQVNRGFSARGDSRVDYLQVAAFLSEPRIDEVEIAQRLARLAVEDDPSAMKLDVVEVLLVYGYDIGIASAHRSHAHGKTAAEWLQ
jgi:uncharacterized RDD family membrane protein YckC